jgi:hypothetical protein
MRFATGSSSPDRLSRMGGKATGLLDAGWVAVPIFESSLETYGRYLDLPAGLTSSFAASVRSNDTSRR